jgi:hypothetical protein
MPVTFYESTEPDAKWATRAGLSVQSNTQRAPPRRGVWRLPAPLDSSSLTGLEFGAAASASNPPRCRPAEGMAPARCTHAARPGTQHHQGPRRAGGAPGASKDSLPCGPPNGMAGIVPARQRPARDPGFALRPCHVQGRPAHRHAWDPAIMAGPWCGPRGGAPTAARRLAFATGAAGWRVTPTDFGWDPPPTPALGSKSRCRNSGLRPGLRCAAPAPRAPSSRRHRRSRRVGICRAGSSNERQSRRDRNNYMRYIGFAAALLACAVLLTGRTSRDPAMGPPEPVARREDAGPSKNANPGPREPPPDAYAW